MSASLAGGHSFLTLVIMTDVSGLAGVILYIIPDVSVILQGREPRD